MPRSVNSDADDLLQYIEEGAGSIGRSVAIPSPDGRNRAGWSQLQDLKVQPEVMTMLEQLRQHVVFKGHWKTNTQVAWSMIYLGLKACQNFYTDNSESWNRYRSTFIVHEMASMAHDKQQQQEVLLNSARTYRNVFHKYLDKNTACGKYYAWKTLEDMMGARDMIADKVEFDHLVTTLGPIAIGNSQVFDNRVGDYWSRMYPIAGGEVRYIVMDSIYIELTESYFSELDAIHNPPPEED